MLSNAVLAKEFAIRLEELASELNSFSALDDEELLQKDANSYTETDWSKFPTLSNSINYKVFAELRICIDRLRHRKGINSKYFIDVPSIEITKEDLKRISFIFETQIDFLENPVKQPDQNQLLKQAIEIGTDSNKFNTWLKEIEYQQSIAKKSDDFK